MSSEYESAVQVLYVPSAQRLIEGGTFQKGEDGLWDTPEVAKELLKSMLTNHKQQLADIPTTSGQTLLQVCSLALLNAPAFGAGNTAAGVVLLLLFTEPPRLSSCT